MNVRGAILLYMKTLHKISYFTVISLPDSCGFYEIVPFFSLMYPNIVNTFLYWVHMYYEKYMFQLSELGVCVQRSANK